MLKIIIILSLLNLHSALSTNQSARILTPALGEETHQSGDENIQRLINALTPLRYQKVVVLVHDTEQVNEDAQIYMKHLLNLNIEFLLMKFNSSGISPVLSNSTFKKQFLNYLQWMDSPNTSMVISPDFFQEGVVFFGILRATRILPQNSGIIVFTDYKVEDEDLAQLAIKEMSNKRIKLFIIWEGIYPTVNHEEKLLRDTSYLTGGDFLLGHTETRLSDLYNKFYLTNPGSVVTKSVVAFYTNIKDDVIHFPIESRVDGIHISVTSPVSALELISPNDFVINILNRGEVENFGEGSFVVFDQHLGQYEIQLNAASGTSMTGLWRLDVKNDGQIERGSNVTISVQSRLNVTTFLTYKFVSYENPAEVLRVSISDENSKIKSIAIVDKVGLPIGEKLSIIQGPANDSLLGTEDDEEDVKQEVDIPIDQLPKGSFYLKIAGEDEKGKAFSRLSYFDREKVSYLVQPLSVDVTAGSELLVVPGRYARILFEVTNNRDLVMYVNFLVQDERSLLKNMQPRMAWLNPKQTIIVTVTIQAPNVASSSFRNLVTLTASGTERVKKSAAMYVTNNRVTDYEQPYMTHRYSSDCTDVLIGDCRRSTWVIEVTAVDKDSGLLQLTSMPKGLYFPNSYVAGTREPVVGIYGGSCCQAKIQLIAIDVNNNRRTYTANAYNATPSAGTISAIVLGIILFIILIIVIVICSRKKCCKSKESVDLPTYRSPRSQTRF